MSILKCALCTAAAVAATAEAIPPTTGSPQLRLARGVRDGLPRVERIRDLTTGRAWTPAADAGWRGPVAVTAYDNFLANTRRFGGTPGRLNLASVDPNTLDLLCADDLPLTAPYLRFALETGFAPGDADGQPAGGCADPNETGEVAGMISDGCLNWVSGDARLDDYLLDPNVTGDPTGAGRSTIVRHRFTWTYSPDRPLRPGDDDRQELKLVFVDYFDMDGDGRQQVTGGYSIVVDWDPNGPCTDCRPLTFFDIDLPAYLGAGISAFNRGAVIYDVTNHTLDAAGHPVPGNYACGTLFEWARGTHLTGACPETLTYTTGGPAVPEFWAEFNLLLGTRIVDDPNDPAGTRCLPVDPGADGDPNGLSYEDVLADGVLYNRYACSQTPQLCLSHNVPATLGIAAGGCAGDVDGDGETGLDDLLILLGAFGDPAGPADLDGINGVDLDDLLILLGDFGCD